MTKEEQIEMIKNNPFSIQNINNPDEELQKLAILYNPRAIQVIKNPSRDVKIAAIKRFPPVIEHIKRADDEMKILAVSIYGCAIDYVKNPSDELKMIAIKQDPYSIQYIKNPNAQMKLEAFVFYFEKNKTEMVIRKTGESDLFYALYQKDEETFLSFLSIYKKELEELRYFENMLHYLSLYRKQWTDGFIEAMLPLTTDQERIWKACRLKQIVS